MNFVKSTKWKYFVNIHVLPKSLDLQNINQNTDNKMSLNKSNIHQIIYKHGNFIVLHKMF